MRFKEIQRKDPELKIRYIAERLGVSVSYIYGVRKEMEGRKG
jgi:predicted DNA-binding transcriptional regulator AlpA